MILRGADDEANAVSQMKAAWYEGCFFRAHPVNAYFLIEVEI